MDDILLIILSSNYIIQCSLFDFFQVCMRRVKLFTDENIPDVLNNCGTNTRAKSVLQHARGKQNTEALKFCFLVRFHIELEITGFVILARNLIT